MSKGYFLIEALLSIVIFAVLILSVFSMISFLQRRTMRSSFEAEATILVQDAMEITHTVILSDWAGYPDGTYYPVFNADSNSWILFPGEENPGIRISIKNRIISAVRVPGPIRKNYSVGYFHCILHQYRGLRLKTGSHGTPLQEAYH